MSLGVWIWPSALEVPTVLVGSEYSSGPAVISKQATKAFSAADLPASRKRSWDGEEQGVPFALMVAFRMEMGGELGHSSVK